MKQLTEKQFNYIVQVAERIHPLFLQYGWDIFGLQTKDIIVYKIEELAKHITKKMDKGFKIVLHKEGVSEKVIEQHEQNGYIPISQTKNNKKTEKEHKETVSLQPMMSGQSSTFINLPGVQRILNLMNAKEQQLFTLLLDHDGSWFSREKLPLLLGYASIDTMRHSIDYGKMISRGWIESQREGRTTTYRTNMRGKMGA